MIILTRLSGSAFALNPDLIQRVDATPDTVVTLVDGAKFVIRESLAEVVERVTAYRAQIVASASALERDGRDTDQPQLESDESGEKLPAPVSLYRRRLEKN